MAKRIHKRRGRAKPKRQTKFPEIKALSEEEREDLEQHERTLRWEDSRYAIDEVVRRALVYNAETRRDDPAHGARQDKAYWRLREAIERAFQAMHRGPITDQDLAMVKSLRESGWD